MRSQVQMPAVPLESYFNWTRADIVTSRNLGFIDSQDMADGLSQRVLNVQRAIARGQIGAASNMVRAFKNHVNAQAGKHITAIAVDILREDADLSLSQLSQTTP